MKKIEYVQHFNANAPVGHQETVTDADAAMRVRQGFAKVVDEKPADPPPAGTAPSEPSTETAGRGRGGRPAKSQA